MERDTDFATYLGPKPDSQAFPIQDPQSSPVLDGGDLGPAPLADVDGFESAL